MDVFGDVLTTKDLPETRTILSQKLPRIFKSRCYNKSSYSFWRESKSTEIGHLFEHILLEYLMSDKFLKYQKLKRYKGVTCWDWNNNKRGTFDIEINCGIDEVDVFGSAIGKSVALTNKIMNNDKTDSRFRPPVLSV